MEHPDFPRYIIYKDGVYSKITNTYLKPWHNSDGYLQYGFSMIQDNKRKMKQRAFHKLLADCYIPNPNNFTQVNHKDCNKLNNDLDNLEWCSHSYNNNSINKKKFGSITNTKNNTYCACVTNQGYRCQKTFKTHEDAEVFICLQECIAKVCLSKVY
jgi:hypothetical protein